MHWTKSPRGVSTHEAGRPSSLMSSVTKRRSWHPGEGTGEMRAGAAISFYFEKKKIDITDIGDTDTIISPNNATIAQCLQVPWR